MDPGGIIILPGFIFGWNAEWAEWAWLERQSSMYYVDIVAMLLSERINSEGTELQMAESD